MIREATLADIPALVELGYAIVLESPRHSRTTYNPFKVATMLQAFITASQGAVFVAEVHGEIIGTAVAYLDAEWFSDDPVAQELCILVAKEKRGTLVGAQLIKRMDEWAQSQGAYYLQAGAGTGIDIETTIALYERLGFKRAAIGVERFYH